MSNLFVSSLLVVLIVSSIQCMSIANGLEDPVEKLSAYLESEVPGSDGADENHQAVQNWVDSVDRDQSAIDKNTLMAYKNLIELYGAAKNVNNCVQNGRFVVSARRFVKDKQQTRVGKIVNELVTKYADICGAIVKSKFVSTRELMSKILTYFSDKLASITELKAQASGEYKNRAPFQVQELLSDGQLAQSAYEMIAQSATYDSDVKKILPGKKSVGSMWVTELYYRHITAPCRRLVQHLSEEAETLKEVEQVASTDLTRDHSYRTLAVSYSVCSRFLIGGRFGTKEMQKLLAEAVSSNSNIKVRKECAAERCFKDLYVWHDETVMQEIPW